MPQLDPTVQVALIGAAVTLLGGAIEGVRRKLNSVEEHAHAARAQVQNSHKTNLRDDMDRLHDDVREVLEAVKRQGSEISGLRRDLRVEREERMQLAHRVDHALISD